MPKTPKKPQETAARAVLDAVGDAGTPKPAASQAKGKRRPGAPAGNQNRTVAGLRRAKKRTRPVNEDPYDRQGRKYSKGVFEYFGKPQDPRCGTLGDIESGLRRTRARCDLRGWFDSSGETKEAAKQYYVLLDRKAGLLKDLENERLRAVGRGTCANCGGDIAEQTTIRMAFFHPDNGGRPVYPTGAVREDIAQHLEAHQHDRMRLDDDGKPYVSAPTAEEIEADRLDAERLAESAATERTDPGQGDCTPEPSGDSEATHTDTLTLPSGVEVEVMDQPAEPDPAPGNVTPFQHPKPLKDLIDQAGGPHRWKGFE